MAIKKKKKKASRAPSKANRSYKTKKRNSGKKKSNGVSMSTIKAMFAKKKKKNGKKRYNSRNPMNLFGQTGGAKLLGITAGIVGGVTVAKLVPPMFPAAWTATDLGRFGTTLGVAVLEAIAANMILPSPYRDGVIAGGAAQTLSVALNPILRSVSSTITLGRIRQRGMNDFVPGNFPEPYNPIYNRMLTAGMAVVPGAVGAGVNVGRYKGRFQ